jgi:hypothetical protein
MFFFAIHKFFINLRNQFALNLHVFYVVTAKQTKKIPSGMCRSDGNVHWLPTVYFNSVRTLSYIIVTVIFSTSQQYFIILL